VDGDERYFGRERERGYERLERRDVKIWSIENPEMHMRGRARGRIGLLLGE